MLSRIISPDLKGGGFIFQIDSKGRRTDSRKVRSKEAGKLSQTDTIFQKNRQDHLSNSTYSLDVGKMRIKLCR